jgi:glycine/D-amino acid oxidase-like deaminating enzyme
MAVPYLRKSPAAILKTFGEEQGAAINRAAIESFQFLIEFIVAERIDCDFSHNERFLLADNPAQLHHLQDLIHEFRHHGVPTGFETISGEELAAATDLRGFVGGIVTRSLYSLHPGKYVAGLLRLARAAGVTLAPFTDVQGVRHGAGFEVLTSRGALRADQVAIGTNGYTGGLTPWLRRRIVPVVAYMAATAPLEPGRARRLFPAPRSYTTSNRNLIWIRSSPDGARILFGGRTGMREGSLQRKAKLIQSDAAKILPDLGGMPLTHCWEGNMGFTFDGIPHLGERDGLCYALGYCGVGLTMGTWLGRQLGEKMLGRPHAAGMLTQPTFPARFYYRGRPWFLPLAIASMNFRDRRDARKERA